MSIKDILVHVDMSGACDVRLRLTAYVARWFDARVAGAGVPEAEEKFTKLLRLEEVQGEWHTAARGSVASYARAADLVILGQRDADEPTAMDTPEDVILACGRPVLVVPHAWRGDRVGEHVLIAWNGSREAARAVYDGLPFMTMASSVTVLSVNLGLDHLDGEEGRRLRDDLVRHLERHGINARAELTEPVGVSVSDTVLSRAADVGADLIVMGAYGHSRLRELILGGTTHDMLNRAILPVLMAH